MMENCLNLHGYIIDIKYNLRRIHENDHFLHQNVNETNEYTPNYHQKAISYRMRQAFHYGDDEE